MGIRCFGSQTRPCSLYNAFECRGKLFDSIKQPGNSFWCGGRIEASVIPCRADNYGAILLGSKVDAFAEEDMTEWCCWLTQRKALAPERSYRQFSPQPFTTLSSPGTRCNHQVMTGDALSLGCGDS